MNRRHLSIISLLGSLLILPTSAFTTDLPANYPHSIQVARSLSPTQIRQLAQAITVKVLTNRELGSGILIAKQGSTYTVLTNAHVLNAKGNYRIQTPDGVVHSAVVKHKGSSLQGNDLAVLQFSAKKTYRIVALAKATSKAENQNVYAAGFAIDSPQLLTTTGKIALITPKPLLGGYQLGYTNQIKQGMSGGPLLNQAGELIGVNGLLKQAILNDTYTYTDGTSPTNEVRQQLQKLSFAVPIQTLAQLPPPQETVTTPQEHSNNPQTVAKRSALTGIAGEVDLIAQQITLRIDAKDPENGNGSGVIIAHQGQTYYVLTAKHVVENPDQYTVVTPDGQTHGVNANDIIREEGLDVAIIKFSSPKEYPVATLARYNLSDGKKHWVFLSGFPGSQKELRQFSPGFRFDKDQGFFQAKDTATKLSSGYELVFTNLSLPGMSGGPLLDVKGRVIGIGGRSEGEDFSTFDRNLGYALGVPITTGLGLATKAGIKSQWMKIETSSPPTLTDSENSSIANQPAFTAKKPATNADENQWLNYGNLLWRLGRYDEAVAALSQATKLAPDLYQAYYALGLVLQDQQKYPQAVATFKQVIKISQDYEQPEYYQAWREQSNTLVALKNYPQALTAINQAIKINEAQANEDNPQDFILYVSKGNILGALKRYAEAEVALNEAINIKPSAFAYNNRGILREEIKNYPGAEADYNQAIILSPQLAVAYYNRGTLRLKLEDYFGAEADFTQAIKINPYDLRAYNNRGILRTQVKNYSGAEADYNQAIKINPKYADTYGNRGNLRLQVKNYSGAEADYNQVIKLTPDDAKAHHNRGFLRVQVKNYSGAETDFTQAIKINPDDVRAYYNRGILRYELKNYQGAIADLQTAAQLFDQQGNPEAYQQVQQAISQLQALPSP